MHISTRDTILIFFFWISHIYWREHPLSVRWENCLGKVIVWFYVRCRRDGDNFEHKLYGSGRRGSRVRPVWSGQDVWPSLPSAVFPKRVLPLARRGRVTLARSLFGLQQSRSLRAQSPPPPLQPRRDTNTAQHLVHDGIFIFSRPANYLV